MSDDIVPIQRRPYGHKYLWERKKKEPWLILYSHLALSELYGLCDMNGDCSGGSGTTATEETSTTESVSAEATDSSSGGLGDTSSAVGVTVGPTATETTTSISGNTNNAAASVRVACGAILAAIAGLAIAL